MCKILLGRHVDSEINEILKNFDEEVKNFRSLLFNIGTLFIRVKNETANIDTPNSFVTTLACELLSRIFDQIDNENHVLVPLKNEIF